MTTDDHKPFSVGDSVIFLGGARGEVRQCWMAVGGWRVLIEGPRVPRANPLGLYDLSASAVSKAA